MTIINGNKKCTKCGTIKRADEFGLSKSTKDGLYWCCRTCNSKQAKSHYQTNRDQVIERTNQYRRDHPEINRAAVNRYQKTENGIEATTKWKSENKHRQPGYNREYQKRHRDRYLLSRRNAYKRREEQNPTIALGRRARAKRTYAANPEATRQRARIYRARKFGNGGQHSNLQWRILLAWFDNKCLGCGRLDGIQRDHVIPISKGGTDDISNIQPLCGGIGGCNQRKATKSTDYRDPVVLANFLQWLDDEGISSE